MFPRPDLTRYMTVCSAMYVPEKKNYIFYPTDSETGVHTLCVWCGERESPIVVYINNIMGCVTYIVISRLCFYGIFIRHYEQCLQHTYYMRLCVYASNILVFSYHTQNIILFRCRNNHSASEPSHFLAQNTHFLCICFLL